MIKNTGENPARSSATGVPYVPSEAIDDTDETLVGSLIDGRYRVLSRVGGGGMGAVYRAEHLRLGKEVALKVLRRELTGNPELRQRFDREIRATAAIDHPQVVTVFDTGVLADSSLYYTMELIAGETLAGALRRERRLSWARLRGITLQLCGALAAAHARGIIHRDLKPGNILLTERDGVPDFVKVIDFGIAKVVRDHVSQGLTSTGMALGTPAYMAPEQASGSGDQRIDIYSLGVILYQCLSGQRPFSGQSDLEVLAAVLTTTPRPLTELVDGLPAGLAEVVARAMARDPGDRPETMRALADELRECACEDTAEQATVAYAHGSPHAVDHPVTPVRGTVPLVSPRMTRSIAPVTARVREEPARRPRRVGLFLVVATVLVAVGLFVWSLLHGRERLETTAPIAVVESVEPMPEPQVPVDAAKADGSIGESAAPTSAPEDVVGATPPSPNEQPPVVAASVPVAEVGRPRSLDQALSLVEKRAGTRCRSDLESRIRVELTIAASGRLGERRAGDTHTCVIVEGERLKCWGYNNQGQLGYGHTDTFAVDPTGAPIPHDTFRVEVRAALTEWARATELRRQFYEVDDPLTAQFVFAFRTPDHRETCDKGFTHADNTIAHAFTGASSCLAGVVHLNAGIEWYTDGSNRFGTYDVRSAILHEVGHLLGLPHFATPGHIMFHEYVGVVRRLTDEEGNDAIDVIQPPEESP